jgi:hypothetical protein
VPPLLFEVPPGPQVVVVRDDEDSAEVRGYLKGFSNIGVRQLPSRRTLVRPTPGAADRDTLALDLLLALGKNPETLAGERLGASAWAHARAWLIAAETSDLVIDRAHQLPAARLAELVGLAGWLRCRVWLIWSGGGDLAAVYADAREAGVRCGSVMAGLLRQLLPPPRTVPETARVETRVLPTVEFTTFRAACHRHLSPREFTHVDELYLDAAERADVWMNQHEPLREQGLRGFGGALAAWLRDTHLGPCTDPGAALITLRATQAALFVRGVLLRWDPAALGADPAARLRGALDRRHRPHSLYAGAKTTPAAITVLSLHLNQPPLYFNCWRLHHAAVNGATLTSPDTGTHHHQVPQYLRYPDYQAAIDTASGVEEIACTHTIRLPEPAQVILAAHRAYRLIQGAGEADPLFVATRTGEQASYAVMRQIAIHTAARLRVVPPWLDRDPCRYGGDIGLRQRVFGWLTERGLSVHLLDTDLHHPVHDPIQRRGERP